MFISKRRLEALENRLQGLEARVSFLETERSVVKEMAERMAAGVVVRLTRPRVRRKFPATTVTDKVRPMFPNGEGD